MKKYLLVAFLIVLMTPSVALASWWNPFSWFDFNFFQQVETYEKTTTLPTTSFNENVDPGKEVIVEEKTSEDKTPIYEQNVVSNAPTQPPLSESTAVDLYAKYRDPKTGEIMSPEEYADMIGNRIIDLRNKQINNINYDIYNVSVNSGIPYSPEQLNSIDCAYYGFGCSTSDSVQINNNQYVLPNTQLQVSTVNCSDYQIEKARLDQQSANNGTLFSGARVGAQNTLKAKFLECF